MRRRTNEAVPPCRLAVMIRYALVAAACASVTLLSSGCASTHPGNGPVGTPRASAPDARWTLAWSDEFDGPAGARVDPARWVTLTGGHGWGNNELQTYTDRAENASLSGDGQLLIRAQREHFQGADGIAREYTLSLIHISEPTRPY